MTVSSRRRAWRVAISGTMKFATGTFSRGYMQMNDGTNRGSPQSTERVTLVNLGFDEPP
jgi:hypothetical protein